MRTQADMDERFRADVARHGFEKAWLEWRSPGSCGCLGPRNGEPLCPCEMMVETAKRHGTIVEYPHD